jgi:uncharacterized protein (DUF305 family)
VNPTDLISPTGAESVRVGRILRGISGVLVAGLIAACAPKEAPSPDHSHMAGMAGMTMGMPDPVIPAGANYIKEDVQFMQGMIAHHGQAVVMAAMAVSHGANPQMLKFTEKIAQSQTAEILLMQNWLAERDQMVPDSAQLAAMTMPGMLTPKELQDLAATKGKAFEKLFLLDMIKHHEGALKMVADLESTPLAMQDALLGGFATDIDANQRAEILKMQQMLAELN